MKQFNSNVTRLFSKLNEQFGSADGIDPDDSEEEISEENTTSNLDGGAGQIQTPYAFSKKAKYPKDGAYTKKVEPTDRFFKKWEQFQITHKKLLNK
jgi:hypothetical protein